MEFRVEVYTIIGIWLKTESSQYIVSMHLICSRFWEFLCVCVCLCVCVSRVTRHYSTALFDNFWKWSVLCGVTKAFQVPIQLKLLSFPRIVRIQCSTLFQCSSNYLLHNFALNLLIDSVKQACLISKVTHIKVGLYRRENTKVFTDYCLKIIIILSYCRLFHGL